MKQEIKERIELINKGIVPAGYKKTLVGICPIEWETSKLSELSTFVGGGTPSTKNRSYWEGNIPWISSSDISDEGIYNIFVKKFINEESINNSATKLIPEDSILVVTRVGVGKLAINTVKICTSQDFTNLINIKINKKFLAFYLKELINKNLKNTQGTSIKGITTKELGNYEIFSNNILEQQKIAEILDCATRQVELQEQLVDKLKVQKKAFMQKLLTPQPDWQEVKLGDVVTYASSGGTPKTDFEEYYNGNIVWVSIDDITKCQKYIENSSRKITDLGLKNSSTKLLNPNTILFAMYASIGKCAISKVLCTTSQAILGLVANEKKVGYEYLYYTLCFMEDSLKLLGQKGSQSNLNKQMVLNFNVFLPNLKEQNEITNILKNIDKQIELQQKLLEQYKLRQKALMQLLLTGIVRVN